MVRVGDNYYLTKLCSVSSIPGLGYFPFFPFSETGNPESYCFDAGNPNNISPLPKPFGLTILFAVGGF